MTTRSRSKSGDKFLAKATETNDVQKMVYPIYLNVRMLETFIAAWEDGLLLTSNRLY